jgi:hypothetical protein
MGISSHSILLLFPQPAQSGRQGRPTWSKTIHTSLYLDSRKPGFLAMLSGHWRDRTGFIATGGRETCHVMSVRLTPPSGTYLHQFPPELLALSSDRAFSHVTCHA